MRLKLRSDQTPTEKTDIDASAILSEVREALTKGVARRTELEIRAEALRAGLNETDGLAQRVADTGLVDEAWSVLMHRQAAATELAAVENELRSLAMLIARLETAEHRLALQQHDQPQEADTANVSAEWAPAKAEPARGGGADLPQSTRVTIHSLPHISKAVEPAAAVIPVESQHQRRRWRG